VALGIGGEEELVRQLHRIAALAAVVAGALAPAAQAGHNADVHTPNTSHVATFDDDGKWNEGSDLAFWGTYAIAGNYQGMRVLDIADPRAPREVGQLDCPGSQADVTVWKDLVFLSVDSPRAAETCGAAGQTGGDIEGIRVISIADPAKPAQIAFVKTACGSHTNTLVPDEANNRVLLYVLSYPLGAPTPACNSGHQKISVIGVDLAAPEKAKVLSTPSVGPLGLGGCHDVTVLPSHKLAGAACLEESQLWDISDPVNPKVVTRIRNPQINIHHSATFSWDARTLVIGDEFGGAEVPHSCISAGSAQPPLGALWFYDVSNRAAPAQRGYYRIPELLPGQLCTAHNFNTVPIPGDRDILVGSWYQGGTSAIDFTDPAAPTRFAYHRGAAAPAGSAGRAAVNQWSTYWYNGNAFGNNRNTRGFDVLAIDDPAMASALRLGRLNPQTQESLPPVGGITLAAPEARASQQRADVRPNPSCVDRVAPTSSIDRRAYRLSRRSIVLGGRASDTGCGARVAKVRVAIAREARGRLCRFLLPTGRWAAPRSCHRTSYLTALGGTRWRLGVTMNVPRGRYKFWSRAIDGAGNIERKNRRVNLARGVRR
jgi:hypothetical protein